MTLTMAANYRKPPVSNSNLSSVSFILYFLITVFGVAGCVPIQRYTPIPPVGDTRYYLYKRAVEFQEENVLIKVQGHFGMPGISHLYSSFQITVKNNTQDTIFIPMDEIEATYPSGQIIKEFWKEQVPMKTPIWWLLPQSEQTITSVFDIKDEWVTTFGKRHSCTLSINAFKRSRLGQIIVFRTNFKS